MESISDVGLLQPLIIDSRNQVISGNRRFESIKRLGWKEVDVETMDVKDGEEEILLIHFNKQRIKSFKELINEYLILDGYYRKGQGKVFLNTLKLKFYFLVDIPVYFQL